MAQGVGSLELSNPTVDTIAGSLIGMPELGSLAGIFGGLTQAGGGSQGGGGGLLGGLGGILGGLPGISSGFPGSWVGSSIILWAVSAGSLADRVGRVASVESLDRAAWVESFQVPAEQAVAEQLVGPGALEALEALEALAIHTTRPLSSRL